MEKRCYICGSSRHLQSVCPRRHSVPVLEDGDEYDNLCSNFAGGCAVQLPSGARQTGRPRYQARNIEIHTSANATKVSFARESSHASARYSVRSFCGVCGKYGHLARDCWFREEEGSARLGWYPGESGTCRPGSNRKELTCRDESKRHSDKCAGELIGVLYNDATRGTCRRKGEEETFPRNESSHGRDRQLQRERGYNVDSIRYRPSPEQRHFSEQSDGTTVALKDTSVADDGGILSDCGFRGSSLKVPDDADRATAGSSYDGSRHKTAEHRLTSTNNNEDGGGLTLDSGQPNICLEDECSYDEHPASSGRRRPRRRPLLTQGQARHDVLVDSDNQGQKREQGYSSAAALRSDPMNQSVRRDVKRIGKKPHLTGFGVRERAQANFHLFNEAVVVCYNCGRSGHKSFDCPESGLNRAKLSK